MWTTLTVMHSRTDPLCVYEHAVTMSAMRFSLPIIAERLFPWVRCAWDSSELPKAAQQTFEHLCRSLHL